VPQKEHERVSETGVFPSLDRVSGTLCLSHYVTETSHLYSLRNFWRHFGLCRPAAHSDCCFFAPCTNIFTYLLTYLLKRAYGFRKKDKYYHPTQNKQINDKRKC